jgi:hypothetical protein
MISIPMLGELERDEPDDWLRSQPVSIDVLGGDEFNLIVDGYEEDADKEEFHVAIKNFLSLSPSVLFAAQEHIFKYYEDMMSHFEPGDDWCVEIAKPSDVWKHIRMGGEVWVSRRAYGDKKIYISIECSCDWEQEHGLQIVFKDGIFVNKVGAYDGHVTNSDAYADDDLEDVTYHSYA